jgi:hypothetical protein
MTTHCLLLTTLLARWRAMPARLLTTYRLLTYRLLTYRLLTYSLARFAYFLPSYSTH